MPPRSACVGIDTREVWPLVHAAGSRASAKPVGSSVPPCCLDTMRSTWNGMRGVAAAASGNTDKHHRHAVEQPPANLGPCLSLSGLFGEEAARLCLHDGNQIDGLNEILILRFFRWRECSVLAFSCNSSMWTSNSESARSSRRTEAILGVKASVKVPASGPDSSR
jgi:hypothetical protein